MNFFVANQKHLLQIQVQSCITLFHATQERQIQFTTCCFRTIHFKLHSNPIQIQQKLKTKIMLANIKALTATSFEQTKKTRGRLWVSLRALLNECRRLHALQCDLCLLHNKYFEVALKKKKEKNKN